MTFLDILADIRKKAFSEQDKGFRFENLMRAYLLTDPQGGIVAFVSNGAWLDGNAMSGFRKTLQREFSSIYIFNLRGNCRTSGELSRREGGKIFGSGSRTPIAVTILVKKPKGSGSAGSTGNTGKGGQL